jgi:hypothetical protein
MRKKTTRIPKSRTTQPAPRVVDLDKILRRRTPLDELAEVADGAVRGYKFEQLVAGIFTKQGFRVWKSPGAARPRQTDLFAVEGDEHFLIETKWEQDPSDVSAIDDLRARLQRTPGHVVGLFFSKSGFTGTAVEEVSSRRDRVILLFDGNEIDRLLNRSDLRALIAKKKEALTIQGRVLFETDATDWEGLSKPDPASFPRPDGAFSLLGKGKVPWIVGAGDFNPLVFAQELPDPDWTSEGYAVAVDIPLYIRTREDISLVFEVLHQIGWLSSSSRFTIFQSTLAWHGAGAASFLSALEDWKLRYASAGPGLHHSEDALYYDLCYGGFYTLSIYLQVAERGLIRGARISAQIPGIPYDMRAFREIARFLTGERQIFFRPLARKSITRLRVTHPRVKLEPVGLLVTEDTFVNGIIVRNPFRTARRPPETPLYLPDPYHHMVSPFEFMVCGLSSWHYVDRAPSSYFLRRLELARTSDGFVFDATADWERPNGSKE